MYSFEGNEQLRSMNATELFVGLRKYESVARLYMSKTGRSTLSELTNKLCVDCTARGGPANRTEQIKQSELAIQALLEQELEKIS